MMTPSIAQIERASIPMWNASEEIALDGWLLRFSGGYSGRANSVQTLDPIHRPLAEAVATCEAQYAQRGLPAIFKLTSLTQPPTLEPYLIERGYFVHHRTSVQTLDLADWHMPASPDITLVTGNANADGTLPLAVAQWLDQSTFVKQLSASDDAHHRAILSRLRLPVAYAGVTVGERMVAMGVCALDPALGLCGIFDIGVHPDYRRNGYARLVTQRLITWGKQMGAHTAFLQVETTNQRALPLYGALGFVERYQYWYRHQPERTPHVD